MKLCVADIVSATDGKLICGDLNASIRNVSTDTRSIEIGSFFIALKGERFDGHDFIVKARQLGAAGCLVQRDLTEEECRQLDSEEFAVIQVEDTLKGLGGIATAFRRLFEGRVCAVTGSVGKTSTKDMIASVLSRQFVVQKTLGNFNNEIGLPMTILGLREEHTALVTEMGMRGQGEIDYLAAIARPYIGVITNIGVSHIERLGSKEAILKAKMELAEHIRPGGILVLNGDDPLLQGIESTENYTVQTFGIENEEADFVGKNIRIDASGEYTEFELHMKAMPYEIYNVKINVPGKHNIYNALAAVCTGLGFQMNISDIIDGIGDYTPSGMRQTVSVSKSGFRIINAAYNASPDSMKAALLMLHDIPCQGKRVAVLGDMLELGEASVTYHEEVGRYVEDYEIDLLVTIGELAKYIARGAGQTETLCCEAIEETVVKLKELLHPEDVILVKASRGMRLEQIASALQEI